MLSGVVPMAVYVVWRCATDCVCCPEIIGPLVILSGGVMLVGLSGDVPLAASCATISLSALSRDIKSSE